jgi:hypothetical protein
MIKARRPLTVLVATSALALGGAGSAWACGDGSGSAAGSYPDEPTSQAADYPGSTTTSTSTSASTARAAKARAARARAARGRAARAR